MDTDINGAFGRVPGTAKAFSKTAKISFVYMSTAVGFKNENIHPRYIRDHKPETPKSASPGLTGEALLRKGLEPVCRAIDGSLKVPSSYVGHHYTYRVTSMMSDPGSETSISRILVLVLNFSVGATIR